MGAKIIKYFKQLSITRKVIFILITILVIAYIFCLPRQLFHVPYSTVVTDRNGELLGARIASDGQWRFPPRNTTPEKIKQCLITFEDRHFYHHWGVNPVSTGRAAYQNLKNKRIVSGGSTLTMQTIRLARNKSRTFGEKFIEMILATRLEFRASKEKILSMYVSHAPFGGNVVGLDAAAWRYFGHSAEELSWAEAAMLAVLPNAPAMIHLSKSRQSLLNKRNRLLKQLYGRKIIDSSTYELAISEPLPDEPHPLPQIAPHLVSRFYQERNGKYSVSTIDRGIQTQIENAAERWSNEFNRSDIRNLAILVIDIQTNQVVAYCGNVNFKRKQSGNQVDVIQAPRSTGSILKPFLYYAMLQEGSLLPHTLLPDIPININGFTPQNFSLQFEGAVPASEALARSLNIPAVTMLQKYGAPKFHTFLRQIGLKTINRPASHYGLSLILGGAEATLWDVTNTYAYMGRSLLQLPQTECSLLLSDSENSEAVTSAKTTDIFQPGAVWQTFNALTEVNRPEEIDWKSIPSMHPIAWKTGTSHGFRDAWAVGVTPHYAIGVWVGNATGEGKPGLVGARTAGPVLFDIFSLLPPTQWFKRPGNVFVKTEVCRKSGHLKGRFCEETDTLLILPAGLKTEACPYHHLVTLSADETHRIYENCANLEPTIQKSWFTLPPVWEWYYKQHHPEYSPLPPFKPGCGEDALQPMQFIYPPMNARIVLPKQMDGSPGYMTAELAHGNPATTIFWHLDNTYLTQTQDFHKISLQPTPGKHSLTAVDSAGNTVTTTFYINPL
ncbi:penicillin-binding protein 1C [Bacteroides intestinalis]|uniref:penicillin-binding protein 1C n=1 Tax=Bacteroides intestinalis TaxID=329854 RepID=UPI000E4DB8AA|nr:penicillin-binding protein 1C [Bacteroides intestinalis]RHE81307.1 penicillin-binding protein 1C [Bacteroides intestinalis]